MSLGPRIRSTAFVVGPRRSRTGAGMDATPDRAVGGARDNCATQPSWLMATLNGSSTQAVRRSRCCPGFLARGGREARDAASVPDAALGGKKAQLMVRSGVAQTKVRRRAPRTPRRTTRHKRLRRSCAKQVQTRILEVRGGRARSNLIAFRRAFRRAGLQRKQPKSSRISPGHIFRPGRDHSISNFS
jgi:hypothetical protein